MMSTLFHNIGAAISINRFVQSARTCLLSGTNRGITINATNSALAIASRPKQLQHLNSHHQTQPALPTKIPLVLLINKRSQSHRSGFHFHRNPPWLPIAGKGDVYATKVERKRVIKNPNEPNFEHIEPLKWTTWRMLRDVRRRHIFSRYHFNRACLRHLRKSKLLPNSFRVNLFFYFKFLKINLIYFSIFYFHRKQLLKQKKNFRAIPHLNFLEIVVQSQEDLVVN